MRRMIVAVLMISIFCSMMALEVFAAEGAFELNSGYGVKDFLSAQVGKRVSVRTDAGETLEGTVTKVGDHLLHLSKLTGKDFYDAIVRIDKISSMTIRVKGI